MKQRSAAYPSYPILQSLDFSERIYMNYGNSYRAKREEIAEALNYSVGSLTQKISSAVQYGLLDMKSKEGYKVTDLFVKCYRPISDVAKQEAFVEAFRNPSLYNDLISVFENNILPPLKPLANILLQKHNISEKACDKAAEIFEENAEMILILNDERILSFGSIENEETEKNSEQVEEFQQNNQEDNNLKGYTPVILPPNNQSQNNKVNNIQDNYFDNKPIPHNIPLKNKPPAQLLLPSDVASADFDFIIAYIGLIRQQYT